MSCKTNLHPRYDIFGAKELEQATFVGKYDFPSTPGTVLRETSLAGVSFDHISNKQIPDYAILHFYVHDKRFLPFLANPGRWLAKLGRFNRVVGLDCSVYRDLPLAEQIHSLYLNRAMDWWFHTTGKTIIPNASWGDWRTWDFCFDGIEPYRTVAISSHGACRGQREKCHFAEGLAHLVERLAPPSVIFHGPLFPAAAELLAEAGIQVIPMATRIAKALEKVVFHG